MLTERIKALFQLIEFLYLNVDNFKQYDKIIEEIDLLVIERSKFNSPEHFIDNLKYRKIQETIKARMEVIRENIINPIRKKVIELDVCNLQDSPIFDWRGIEIDIRLLKENFNKADLGEILKYKDKYIDFRTRTNHTYFLDVFFDELDEIAKNFFDFFKS